MWLFISFLGVLKKENVKICIKNVLEIPQATQ